MKTLGLIGGMSWESSSAYYRLINTAVRERLGPLRSAPLLMMSIDFGPMQAAQHAGDWDSAGCILVDAARRLEAGGADAIVLCTNTMHRLADTLTAAVPLPFLHIGDATGEAARAAGYRRVGLLGTAFTMEQPFLRDKLERDWGLEVLVPDADGRADVHRIIYEELCAGILQETSRARYRQVIARLVAQGAEAIILGCTEIPLLVGPQDSPVPLLDTTRLHAQMAVAHALG